MAKTLLRKTNTTESLVINGLLQDDMIIVGENGDKISLADNLADFVGQEIVFSLKTKDEETLEVID